MKSVKDLPAIEALVDAVAEGAPFDALGVVAAEVAGVRVAVGVEGRARRRDLVGAVGAVPLAVAHAGPEDALVVLAAEAVGLARAPLAVRLVGAVGAVLLPVADPLRVHATRRVPPARNLSLRAAQLLPVVVEAAVLVAAVDAVPLAVAAPLAEDARPRVAALELPLVAGRVAEELVAAVAAVHRAVAELGGVQALAVAAGPLGDRAVAVAVGAVRRPLVAAVAAVVVVVAPPPAGDAAPVGAAEVGGVAGARHGEVGALALRLVGAVLAVGVAVAPPVLRDAPPALGALKSHKGAMACEVA